MLMSIATCQEKFTHYIRQIVPQARQIPHIVATDYLVASYICIHRYLWITMLRV